MPTISMPPPITATIEQGRQWLNSVVWKNGVHCPLCGQHAKVYKRKINSGMAHSLIRMYRTADQGWIHVSLIGAKSREEGKLAYWGLVEEQKGKGPHGGRAGYWRVTDYGAQFVRGQAAAATYALVYNGKCLGFEGDPMTIRDALGSDFDYDELMRS